MGERIACPRAKTWMTPCIARDGSTALADDGVCVGCGVDSVEALRDLGDRHPPARRFRQTKNRSVAADILHEQVAAYVGVRA